jgi:hypothetical protein
MAITATTKRKPFPAPERTKAADKAQFERFVEAARQIGVAEDPEALDRAFDKLAPSTTPKAGPRGDS